MDPAGYLPLSLEAPKTWPLRQVMYMSRARRPADCTPPFLEDIATGSQRRNQRIKVSGFLIYAAPFFFQLIEGAPDAIEALYASIQRDARHTHVTTLMDGPSSARQYGDWFMKLTILEEVMLHPTVIAVLTQIATYFPTMWAYLPRSPAVLLLQGKNPSRQPPVPLTATMMFLHIVDFAIILQQPLLMQFLPQLLGAFVEVCVHNVTSQGGQIAKFINGSCMAFWPQDHTAEAVAAMRAIVTDLQTLRLRQPADSALSLLFVAAGMHTGPALLCNAGTRKADFTLLGDSVNVCARVASLAVKMQRALLLSTEATHVLREVSEERPHSVGQHTLKGRDLPMECFCLPDLRLDTKFLPMAIDNFVLRGCGDGDSLHHQPRLQAADLTVLQHMFSSLDVASPSSPMTVRRKRLFGLWKLTPCISDSPRNVDVDLLTLTYVSQATTPLWEADLNAIARHAAKHNEGANITACLLYLNGVFLQTLEGPREAVLPLWERIKADARHMEVVPVQTAPLDHRIHSKPLQLIRITEEMLAGLPPLQVVLTQLARTFICLGAYLPSLIVRNLLAGGDPQNIPPMEARAVMLASDICGFTPLAAQLTLEGVLTLCNTFIDGCTDAIMAHGGEVIKLIGDCVLAVFPPTCADGAVSAARRIVEYCAESRQKYYAESDCRALLYCGVGLDFGPVVITQAASSGVVEFMVTGEVSMRVLKAESVSRIAKAAVVLTEPLMCLLSDPVAAEVEPLPLSMSVAGLNLFRLQGSAWDLPTLDLRRHAGDVSESSSTPGHSFSDPMDSFRTPISSGIRKSLSESFRYADLPKSNSQGVSPPVSPSHRKVSVLRKLFGRTVPVAP
eukprot:EG_transcript_3059